jgi:hypothetical protein
MGWTTIIGADKEHLMNDRLRTQEWVAKDGERFTWKVIAHSLRGNNLWKIVERSRHGHGYSVTERFIALDLIGYDRYSKGWGYKDISEHVGPTELNCPLKFLNMAPQPCDSEQTAKWTSEWREKVRNWHSASAKRRKEMLKVPILQGEKWMLREGLVDRATRSHKLTHVYVGSVYPRFVYATANDGERYKIPKKYLVRRMGEKEVTAEEFFS